MHVSNLLKAVLKPCNFSSKPSNQPMNAPKTASGGPRLPEPRKVLNKQLQEKKRPSSHPKMTCLCAPTTHPGSFRCRMHRASLACSITRETPHLSTPKPVQRSHNNICGQKQVVPTMLWLAPNPQRSRSRPRPSRLSRVVVATQSDNACFYSRR